MSPDSALSATSHAIGSDHALASFDGSRGPACHGDCLGLGWVIDGTPYHEHVPAAPDNTSNVAEYLALVRVLEWAATSEVRSIEILGDSQFVIRQVQGGYGCKASHLLPHRARCRELLKAARARGCGIKLRWIPRQENGAADAASRLGLRDTQAARNAL